MPIFTSTALNMLPAFGVDGGDQTMVSVVEKKTVTTPPAPMKKENVTKITEAFNATLKPSSKESVPVWHSSSDPIQNQNFVETYIFDLKD